MPSLGRGNVTPVTRSIATLLAALMVLLPATSYAGPAEGTAATQVAALSIASDPPGASVYVDGQFAGQTPVNVGRLTAGEHRVRLVKDGYLENGRVVSVSAKQPNTVQVKLTRSGASADDTAMQVTGGGGGGGGSKKWIIIGAAAGGGVAAALLLANRNKAPTVSGVTATPNQGLAGSTSVSFAAQASDPDGDSLSYSWNFGDGSTGTGATPSHTYAAAGTFNVGVDVSDGKKSASGSTSVTIRSMAGTWTGSFAGFNFTMNLAQNGTNITGSYLDSDGPGTVSGSVSSGNRVTLTVNQPPFSPYTFSGTADNAVSTVSGSVLGVSFTMRR